MLIRLGGVYRVIDLIDHWQGVGVMLAGVPTPPTRRYWRADRFRPVYRPRADFIDSLKAPPIEAPPIPVMEPA